MRGVVYIVRAQGNARALLRFRRRNPCHTDHFLFPPGEANTGGPTNWFAVDQYWRTVGRRDRSVQFEPYELALQRALLHARQRCAADEVWLIKFGHPSHASFVGVAESVGIHADYDVLLFQAQHALRLYPKGPQVYRGARLQHLFPEMASTLGRRHNLPAHL